MGKSLTDARIAALLAIGVALLFSDVLFGGAGFYVRDVLRDYLPSHFVLRSIVLRGEFPSWNRFYSAGQPLAANPGFQTFYPGTWLALLPHYPWGFNFEIVLHVTFAAAGMFLLLRSMELKRTSALFGAAAFALGGVVLSLTNLLPFLTSIVWWPWIVMFLRRRQWGGFAVALGMLLLAAEVSMIVQTAMLVAAAWLSLGEGERLKPVIPIVLALGIASVQLAPALDLKHDSGRAHSLSYEDATAWRMPAVRPAELFDPHVFGRITDDGREFRGASSYRPPRLPLIFSIYCGLLVPLLAIAGVVLRVAKWTWPLIALSYLLAIGSNGPLIPLLYRIGIYRSIRYPEKFVLFGLFALIVLAAATLDRLDGRVALFFLLFTVGDLLLHVNELAPAMPRRFFSRPPVVLALSDAQGPSRIFHEAEWPVWGSHAIPLEGGDRTYWSEKKALLPFLPALYGLQTVYEIDINLTTLRPTADFLQSMWESLQHGAPLRPFMLMGNAEYLIVPGRPIRILRGATLPRYWFADHLQRCRGREQFVADMTAGRWSDRTAFVDFPPFVPAPGRIVRGLESSHGASFRVRTEGQSFLVASVTPHKYWQASIDGLAVPLRTANLGFQGVVVPPGEHTVAFEYHNPLFAVFGSLSILCLIIVAIYHVSLRKRLAPGAWMGGGKHGRDQAVPDLLRGGSDGRSDTGHAAARRRAVFRSELARVAHRAAARGGTGPMASPVRFR